MTDVTIITPGPLAKIAYALRERLEAVFPKRFSHEWMPPKVTKDVWRQLTRKAPLVGIGFNNFTHPQTTSSLDVLTEWTLYLVTKNEGGIAPMLFGDKFAPGFFSLAEVGAAAVHGMQIKGIGTVQVKMAAMAYPEDVDDPGLAMAAIELTVKADLSIANVLAGEGVTPANLTTQTITWTFDADTSPDLTDTITNAGTA
jgi:hypothetical protein